MITNAKALDLEIPPTLLARTDEVGGPPDLRFAREYYIPPAGLFPCENTRLLGFLPCRLRNLATFRIAGLAKARREQIEREHVPKPSFNNLFNDGMVAAGGQEEYEAADEQARQELGGIHKLIDIGEPATIEGLMKELDIKDRLDSSIDKCLKRLLMVRGVKSLSLAPSRVSTPQISASRK